MSKTSQKNKELKAAGKLPKKGKAAKTAEAKAAKKSKNGPTKTAKVSKPSVPNEGKCCTCQNYKRENGYACPCAKTKAYTPRKATCGSYKLASRFS